MAVRITLIDPGPAHSAKNTTGPGLPNNPATNWKGRTPMVDNEATGTEVASLARQQAAGLRALADLLEWHPELAERLSFALCHMGQPLVERDGDVRGVLEEFRAAAEDSPAMVTVVNDPDRCRVVADFGGGVRVTMSADADLMAGTPQPATYLPLGGGA